MNGCRPQAGHGASGNARLQSWVPTVPPCSLPLVPTACSPGREAQGFLHPLPDTCTGPKSRAHML